MGFRMTTLALALVATLAGLAAEASAGGAPTPIRIAYGPAPAHVLPVIFANPQVTPNNGKTYKADLISMRASSAQLQALAARELDIAWLAYASFANAILNAKLDLRIVADIQQWGVPGYYEGVWGVLESAGIDQPQQLRGKRVAVPALGTGADFALRATLEKHGLEATKDYTIVEVNFPNMGPTLRDGKVDAAFLINPWWAAEQAKGGVRALFGPSAGLGRIQALFFAARTDFLKEHRGAAQDFFTDYLRGLRWLLDPANRSAAVDTAAKVTMQKREVIDAFFLTPSGDFYRDPEGRLNMEALQRNVDYLSAKGFISGKLDVARYVDLSFLEEAQRRLR